MGNENPPYVAFPTSALFLLQKSSDPLADTYGTRRAFFFRHLIPSSLKIEKKLNSHYMLLLYSILLHIYQMRKKHERNYSHLPAPLYLPSISLLLHFFFLSFVFLLLFPFLFLFFSSACISNQHQQTISFLRKRSSTCQGQTGKRGFLFFSKCVK